PRRPGADAAPGPGGVPGRHPGVRLPGGGTDLRPGAGAVPAVGRRLYPVPGALRPVERVPVALRFGAVPGAGDADVRPGPGPVRPALAPAGPQRAATAPAPP